MIVIRNLSLALILLLVAGAVLVPMVGATTVTVFSENSTDGIICRQGTALNWSNIYTGVGTFSYTAGSISAVELTPATTTDTYSSRCNIVYGFNTTIPPGAIVKSAIFGVFRSNAAVKIGDVPVHFVNFNNKSITNSGYRAFGTTPITSSKNLSVINSNKYWNFSATSGGISNINASGYTWVGLTTAWDETNIPGWLYGSGNNTYVEFRSADYVSVKPFIEYTYEIPSSTPTITRFSQNYSTIGSIPSNVAMIDPTSYGGPASSIATMTYDTNHIIGKWDATRTDGEITIGGLSPETDTTLNMTIGVNQTVNSQVNIYYGGMFWALTKSLTDETTTVYQYYKDSSGTTRSQTGIAYSSPFTIVARFDGANNTYTTNTDWFTLSTPLYNSLENDQVSGNIVRIAGKQFGGPDPNLTAAIYSISQTVPKDGNITAIGDSKTQSFGIDGPHTPNTTWVNGTSFISSYGGKGTIWYDASHLTVGTDVNPYVQALLDDGWELGMHETLDAGTVSEATFESTMDTEFAAITAYFGQPPTSFCGLRNNETEAEARYAYTTHGMIWRNGAMGTFDTNNGQGNIDNSTWPWWSNATPKGMISRVFSHELDITPAEIYSIDKEKFEIWVSDIYGSGNNVVPYLTWYKTGLNTNESSFTENPSKLGESYNFTALTNGYPALVEIPISYTTTHRIVNVTGGITDIPYRESYDGNIEFYVDDGSTYLIDPNLILASFTPSGPVSAYHPVTITFTDTSTGSPTAWNWSFGDGNYSAAQNPTYTWPKPGMYLVTLNASTASAYSKNSTYVEVDELNFAASQRVFTGIPAIVTFTDLSHNSTAWNWNFGDGTTSTDQNPIKIYFAEGDYPVELTGTDMSGSKTVAKPGYISIWYSSGVARAQDEFATDLSPIYAAIIVLGLCPIIVGIGLCIYGLTNTDNESAFTYIVMGAVAIVIGATIAAIIIGFIPVIAGSVEGL